MYLNHFDARFAQTIYEERYQHPSDGDWSGSTKRVIGSVTGALYEAPKAQQNVQYIHDLHDRLFDLMGFRKLCPGGRYLYSAGRDFHQVNNCLLLNCPDSREGWAMTSYQAEMALMSGAGIGVWYGDLRPAGAPIKRTGGESAGPLPKMMQVNDTGRHVISGGNRRSAIWAGLPWWHQDIFEFITCKDWSDEIKALKEKDWKFPAPMDFTNISVTLDGEFFEAYFDDLHPQHGHAVRVYEMAVAHMLRHGEPGFTVDVGAHAGEVLRNACTEIVSADDSDVCNLGSLVLPRFSSVDEFERAVEDAVMFLTAGSLYSLVPYDKVAGVREKNRRLGLGLIGVHEFVMKHGLRYGSDESFELLEPYLRVYSRALEFANEQQDMLGISPSVAATAIAPNGTIGAVMESTPSNDPMFSSAEIRTVRVASAAGRDTFERHIVVDPSAARLVREGVSPHLIEDAYDLALYPERRLRHQVFVQEFVDQSISSTLNIEAPIEDPGDAREFGDTLIRYLPKLRGVTVYPNGARAGQPRTPVDLEWALEREGTLFEAELETCSGGVCGI